MRYSGVEWIGEIPDNWALERLQWHLEEIKESNDPVKTKQVLSLTNKLGVIPYEEKGEHGNKAKENVTEYKIAYPNTIVANSMNILIGSVGKCEYFGCVSPVYYVFKPKKGENIDFLNYVFQVTQFQKELRRFANGILEIRLRVSSSDILKRYIAFPPKEEQQKIVNFLNQKTQEIDSLIEIENQQIEKLKEYKQAVITEAVTKGLNKNAAMKDSGITWIGKIPEGWNTIKIKFTSWLKGRIGWDGLKSSEFLEEGPYLITGTDFIDGCINRNTCVHISEERFMEDELLHIYENDLLITKDGTIGKLAIVKNCPKKVSLNSGVMIIRNTTKWRYLDKYLYYVLSSKQFYLWYELSQSGNSTIKHLYQGQFYNFEFTYPSLDEQERISDYLDEKCDDIDKIIYIKKSKIDQLIEYKKSLIYEFVTGKKVV